VVSLDTLLSAHRLSVSEKKRWGVFDGNRLGAGGCLTPLRYRLDHRGPLCSAHALAIISRNANWLVTLFQRRTPVASLRTAALLRSLRR